MVDVGRPFADAHQLLDTENQNSSHVEHVVLDFHIEGRVGPVLPTSQSISCLCLRGPGEGQMVPPTSIFDWSRFQGDPRTLHVTQPITTSRPTHIYTTSYLRYIK